MNKIDQLEPSRCEELKASYPDGLFISTLSPSDIQAVHSRILSFFEKEMIEDEIVLSYSQSAGIGTIRRDAKVLSERYEEAGIVLQVRASAEVWGRIRKKLGTIS